MNTNLRLLSLIAIVLAASLPAAAHHSGAIFNRDLVTAVQGTVSRFHWGNPHVYIYVETTNEAGELREWEVETDATPILSRSGWNSDTLAPGDQVVVRMNPVFDARRTEARLVSLTKADGSIWSARSSFAGSTEDLSGGTRAESIAGVWATPMATNAHMFVLRDSERELTERGAAMKAAYEAADSPAGQCIAYPTPMFLAIPYLNEIEIQEDRVTITGELYNTVRTIHTDGRTHPDNGALSNQGHSIGRWEGDTLVVSTTLLEEHRSSLIDGAPMGTQRTVTERFRLSEDGTRLLIDFQVEDPEFLAAPLAGTLEWVHMPELELIGIDCDPNVSRRAWE